MDTVLMIARNIFVFTILFGAGIVVLIFFKIIRRYCYGLRSGQRKALSWSTIAAIFISGLFVLNHYFPLSSIAMPSFNSLASRETRNTETRPALTVDFGETGVSTQDLNKLIDKAKSSAAYQEATSVLADNKEPETLPSEYRINSLETTPQVLGAEINSEDNGLQLEEKQQTGLLESAAHVSSIARQRLWNVAISLSELTAQAKGHLLASRLSLLALLSSITSFILSFKDIAQTTFAVLTWLYAGLLLLVFASLYSRKLFQELLPISATLLSQTYNSIEKKREERKIARRTTAESKLLEEMILNRKHDGAAASEPSQERSFFQKRPVLQISALTIILFGAFAFYKTLTDRKEFITNNTETDSPQVQIAGEETESHNSQLTSQNPQPITHNSNGKNQLIFGDLVFNPSENKDGSIVYQNGDFIINVNDLLKIKPHSITSRKIRWHAIEKQNLATGSITSRTIQNEGIQGEDINPDTDITVDQLTADTIDLGTNTISDGVLTGNWNFGSGNIITTGTITGGATGLSGGLDMNSHVITEIGSANTYFSIGGGLTLANILYITSGGADITGDSSITGDLTLNGTLALGANTIITSNTALISNLNADYLDGQHGSYYAPLANIAGTQNYLAKFGASGNTIGNSVIYDNGTNVGIGTTNPLNNLVVRGSDTNFNMELTGFSHNFATSVYTRPNSFYTASRWSSSAGGAMHVGITSSAAQGALNFIGASNIAAGSPITVAPTTFISYQRSGTGSAAVDATNPAIDFYNGAGSWGLAATPLVRILGNGNVGIGTTNPGALLELAQPGDSEANGMRFTRTGATRASLALSATSGNLEIARAGTSIMSVGTTNVGIGTTAPSTLLHIQKDQAAATIMRIGNLSTDSGATTKLSFGTGSSEYSYLEMNRNSNRLTLANTNATVGHIYLTPGSGGNLIVDSGNVGIGTTSPGAKLDVNGAVKLSGTDNILLNNNWLSGDGGDEGVFVNSNGSVGIGTTNPYQKFSVYGGDIWMTGTNGLNWDNGNAYIRSTNSSPFGIAFSVYNGSSTAEVMRMIGSGYVGISTTAPNSTLSVSGNVSIGNVAAGTSGTRVLVLSNGTVPSTSPADSIQLYSEDVAASSELKVRDEAGNITTLSPHNFSLIPQGPSEQLAWSYYSQRKNLAVNVDMAKTIRLVEQLSGEQLIYLKDLKNDEYLDNESDTPAPLALQILDEQKSEIAGLTLATSENVKTLDDLIKLIDDNTKLTEKELDSLNNELSAVSERVDSLEEQMKAIAQRTNQEFSLAQIEQNTENIELIGMVLGVERVKNPEDVNILGELSANSAEILGTVKAKDIEAEESIKGKSIQSETLELGNATRGTDVIKEGDTEVKIKTSAVSKESQIYVTPREQYEKIYYSQKDIKEGESFTVKIEEPVSHDVQFNWLIIN